MTPGNLGRFVQIGAANYAFGPELVKIEFRAITNTFGDQFPIQATITFGDKEFKEELDGLIWNKINNYRLRIRYCKLYYTVVGCCIPEYSKYRMPIQRGAFSRRIKTSIVSKGERKISGEGNVGGELTKASSSVGLNLGLAGNATKGKNRETDIESVEQINLIEPIPNGWAIGIEGLGDPFRENINCCLRSCYFDQVSDEHPYTCLVKFDEGSDGGALKFALSAKGGLYVEKLDADGRSELEVKGKPRGEIIERMRSKIAGMVMEKTMNDGVIIADATYIVEKTKDYTV